MYVKDFDRSGVSKQILSVYNHGTSYPIAMRDELIRALPYLKPRYPRYQDYAGQTVTDIFSPAELAGATFKQAHTFATALARNNGDGSFTLSPLPLEAQLAPVYGILAQDVDGDGKPDLLLAGNFDGVQPEIGRMSASYGLLLRGDGHGKFAPVREAESGFFVPGQARDIQRLRTRRGDLYVVARNNAAPLFFRRSGSLRANQDHAVGAARAVRRGIGRIAQHGDRLDVVRIDRRQVAARIGAERDAVDHDQHFLVAEGRRSARAANAQNLTAIRSASERHAGNLRQQELLERRP